MNLPPSTGVKLRHTDRQPKNRMGGLLDNINSNTQSESAQWSDADANRLEEMQAHGDEFVDHSGELGAGRTEDNEKIRG
ncbi:hypothetical protein AAVH_33043 [Aphelenchoides avenae]|nr:hypothetical protein AAVH_33043 [Aphelenchus avenae]